jgi:hypothetical protein
MPKRKRINPSMKFYIWLFLLTMTVIILGIFIYQNYCKLNSSAVIKTKSNDMQVNAIVLIAGFLCAFSAISIYSIFNANVDHEREKINKIITKAEKMNKKISNLLKKAQKDSNKVLDSFIKQLDENIKFMNYMNNLTSPYTENRKKREAIMYFSTLISVKEDLKNILLNYYEAQKMNPNEVGKKYFQELQALLVNWNMIDTEK